MKFTGEWLVQISNGNWHGRVIGSDEISIDSRTLRGGALYLALRGEVHDGHKFVAAARDAGAAGAVIDAAALAEVQAQAPGFPLLAVADTFKALQAFGHAHRLRSPALFVGIAGSNGKTTTKEMVASVLSQAGPTHRTTGNLNNHIGVPLSLLRVDLGHRFAVLECGMNHPGELLELGRLLEPDVVLITALQAEHLEGLGSLENVAKAEGELFATVRQDGAEIFPSDEPLMRFVGHRAKTQLGFGESESAQVRLLSAEVSADGGTNASYTTLSGPLALRLPQLGKHNALNAAAAIAVGLHLGLPLVTIKAGLQTAPLADRRLRIHRTSHYVVLDDCYNANPGSMAAALEVLHALGKGHRRVAILGDMLELGSASESEHHKLGELAVDKEVDLLIVLGRFAKAVTDAAVAHGLSPEAIAYSEGVPPLLAWVKPRLRKGDVILVKGSRGMKMERIVKALGVEASEGSH